MDLTIAFVPDSLFFSLVEKEEGEKDPKGEVSPLESPHSRL